MSRVPSAAGRLPLPFLVRLALVAAGLSLGWGAAWIGWHVAGRGVVARVGGAAAPVHRRRTDVSPPPGQYVVVTAAATGSRDPALEGDAEGWLDVDVDADADAFGRSGAGAGLGGGAGAGAGVAVYVDALIGPAVGIAGSPHDAPGEGERWCVDPVSDRTPPWPPAAGPAPDFYWRALDDAHWLRLVIPRPSAGLPPGPAAVAVARARLTSLPDIERRLVSGSPQDAADARRALAALRPSLRAAAVGDGASAPRAALRQRWTRVADTCDGDRGR